MKVFLEEYYNLLVVLHLLATFVLVGAMTHNLLIVLRYVRGKFGRKKLEYFYVKVSLWAYVVVYALGALAYPAFRINTRMRLFDENMPWATGLFEVKEHWGALGLALFVVYYLLRDYRDIARTLKEPRKQIYAALFLIPIALFFLLSFWKVIGLHWVLSFYPFLFIGLAHVFTRQQWRRSLYFMIGFAAVHVLASSYLLFMSPGLLKSNQDIMQSYIYSSHGEEINNKLNEIAPGYQWAANSYTDAAVLSYFEKQHVIQFGEGSYHARQDDMLTDYRELDGKNILIVKYSDKLQQFAHYFNEMETGSFNIAGATYYYAKGKGFKYLVYREEMLEQIMQFYYEIPGFLPVGSCYMFEKYGRPKVKEGKQ